MLIPILSIVAVVVLLAVVVVSVKSNDFQVSRSIKVSAPAERAFDQVNDLRCMNAWNPWVKLDSRIKLEYAGPSTGVGAICSWDGDKNVGAGRQTIVESVPHSVVRMKLEFFRPFAGVNDVQFAFVDESGDTRVTWSMTGKLNFIMKAMGFFCSMDKMCGQSFEKGLADLKEIVEGRSGQPSASLAR